MELDIQKFMKAARSDIFEILNKEQPLCSRDFAGVIEVAHFAERIASADGRPDFNSTLQRVIVECEFNKTLKHLYAALAAHFADGEVVLYDKYRRLQQTHAQVEGTRLGLEAAQTLLNAQREAVETERTALAQMREALQLGSGSVNLSEMPALPPMSEVFDDKEKKE